MRYFTSAFFNTLVPPFLLLMLAPLLYVMGVQLSTFTINVPLNGKLQTLQVDATGEADLKAAGQQFEHRWNR